MSLRGKLIEYIDHGRFICAMVVDDNGKRLRLVNQNGRDVNLPVARVIHHSQASYPVNGAREELIKTLKVADETRQEIGAPVSLQDIWELANDSAESAFDPRFLAELCFGEEATDDHVAAFLRRVFADRLYFKYKEGKILAHAPEVVDQLKLQAEQERRREALLANGVKGIQQIWQGDVVYEWPEREYTLRLVRDYYLFGNDAPESNMARTLLKNAGLNKPHDAFRLLVKAGVWDEHENVPLLKYQLPVDFPEEVIRESKSIADEDEALRTNGRRDLRHLPLLTIDGENTRDHDDALHLEKRGGDYLVGIHISDVANYVKPGSLLFDEAVRRATSVYFADGMVPMLPSGISEGVCSLKEGQDRAAMSFMVLLSPSGEVLEYEILPSIVNVKRQLSYKDAEQLVDSDDELKILAGLSKGLRQKRIDAGALILPIPDVNITIGQDRIKVGLADVDSPARLLVAEFMVLANTIAAEYVAERQVPGLFRAQEPPHQRFVQGVQKDLFLNFKQRRQLKPGALLTGPQRHSGVGAMQYTTITSPIRRLLDLVMQHQVFSLVKGKGALFGEEDMKDFIGTIITSQSKVNLVRRLRHRYWLLKYLEPKVGSRVEGLLVEKGSKRANAVLLDCLLDADLPPNQAVKAKPGDIVQVKIAKVKPLDNILRLEW